MSKPLSQEYYRDLLISLLPKGEAWAPDINSNLYKLLDAISEEFARLDYSACSLLKNAIPSESDEFQDFLVDWEKVVGLPDQCFTPSDHSDLQRKRLLLEKLNGNVGQNVNSYLQVIKNITGEDASISFFKPFRAGISRAGDALTNDGWVHTWKIDINKSTITGPLECVINTLKPAHTAVIFNYV